MRADSLRLIGTLYRSTIEMKVGHQMKLGEYFHAMHRRPDRVYITFHWIQRVIDHPISEVVQTAGVQAMNIKYFQDTDTLYIELFPAEVNETRDLDENTLLEMDADGRLCAITIEHASDRMAIPAFSYQQIPEMMPARLSSWSN